MRVLFVILSSFLIVLNSSFVFANSEPKIAATIKIIHAQKGPKHIDPKLKKIASVFKDLAFTSYKLLDEATFTLDLNSSGKMQFPANRWLEITPRSIDAKQQILVDLAVKKIKFSAKARIPNLGTLAIGGPSYKDGVLLLVVTAKINK